MFVNVIFGTELPSNALVPNTPNVLVFNVNLPKVVTFPKMLFPIDDVLELKLNVDI